MAFDLRGAKYFHMPFDGIFSIAGAFRTVDGDTPIVDREFIGGASNLKGYGFREATPGSLRDEQGEPLGGNTSATFTMEYSVPVFNLKKVRAHAFYDGGLLSADSWDPSGDYLSDVGFGIDLYWIRSELFRVDLAFPLEKDQYTDDYRVQFNMGYQFR